jgi:two-component system sensor histidine kinase GlrK
MPVQPASLRQFVLLSFFMALIPLRVLLWQSHSALSDVSRYAIAEAESSVANVRRAENMQKLVNDIERSVLQFSILKTDALSQLAATHLNNYQQNLGSVCLNLAQPVLCAQQQKQLELLFDSYLHESNEELSPILQKIRQQQVQLTQVIWALLEQRLQQQQV